MAQRFRKRVTEDSVKLTSQRRALACGKEDKGISQRPLFMNSEK